MTKIITISRQFGSGGREIGKRLADALGFSYYDREIISSICDKRSTEKEASSLSLEAGLLPPFPLTFGRTFSTFATYPQYTSALLVAQQRIIRELAQTGDCIFVGRCSNSILRDLDPLNLFIYSDMPSKVMRCRMREKDGEHFSDTELKKRIRQIDANRARLHDMFSDGKWGKMDLYHLCVNTSGLEIKTLIPGLKAYALSFFER
ncbi:MAG: cytidylate kinase-like family protein [Clostridia bacterium]|nr:cytidylate kinase-like family protein [Clostridia bacterium]